MNFNSLEYAAFLPIVFALYWALPHKFRGVLLLISSYYFYMSWNPRYVVLILFTTAMSYAAALLLEKYRNRALRNVILAGTLISCLGVLFFFKYFNFASESVAAVARYFSFSMQPITLKLLLPVGISFYTFQTLSYVIDVYRGEVKAERNFGIYAAFISFFPQLVAGPIERTANLLPQIKSEKKFDYDLAMHGARQMLWGFFKKVAVADVAATYVNTAYDTLHSCTGFDLCAAILFFSMQIYCDFSGYSDIAIGTAKLFGINLMTNFKSPYFSTSIKEFWSRWHISLSTWFRDYVYIPLGGSRCSKLRNSFNLLVTFLASGLWHGANWTFVVWGGIHGGAQVVEKALGWDRKRRKNAGLLVLSWAAVFAFCNLAWVFFRADHLSDAWYVICHAFGGFSDISTYLHTSINLGKGRFLYICSLFLIVAAYDWRSLKTDVIDELAKWPAVIRLAAEYAVALLTVFAIIDGTGTNQFVYFQF